MMMDQASSRAGDVDPETRRGMGSPWIAERLTSLGGRLNIESKPGQGSRLILELPLASD